jgi:hypothetical protein
MECLIHERSINLGLALDRSTNQIYSFAVNLYVMFCDLHHLALDPTPDNLSLFVMFMSAHINPCSVDNYLLGICSVFEEYYPQVRQHRCSWLVSCTLKGTKWRYGVLVRRKLTLTRADLQSTFNLLPSPPTHATCYSLCNSLMASTASYTLESLFGQITCPCGTSTKSPSTLL